MEHRIRKKMKTAIAISWTDSQEREHRTVESSISSTISLVKFIYQEDPELIEIRIRPERVKK